MKRKNKFIEELKTSKEENLKQREEEKINYSFQETKKKNIINDLKLKGFNEIQIDDILDTLFRNSVSDRAHLIEEKSNLNIQETHTIDIDLPSNLKIGQEKNTDIEYINSKTKYKNSFIIKTETSEKKNINKNKSKYNCVKIYINASTEKDREIFLDSNENINENNNNGKIINFKKYRNVPHISTPNNNTNTFYSKRINTKIGNYLNKFHSLYASNLNRVEENKNEILKKFENEINKDFKNQRNIPYNNYKFKMIFDSKKKKETIDNIGYFEIKNNSKREGYIPPGKSRNSKKEENKNSYSNSFSINQKKLSNSNQISYDLNEIKEEKEINENKDKNKDNSINIKDEIEKEEKLNKKKNKNKYNNMRKNELIINPEELSNKFINTKKIFSDISNNKKEIQKSKKKKNSIFIIRKQKTEEEEKLAKKNIAIFEIKQTDEKYRNNIIKQGKNNKSKSLTKFYNLENENKNANNFPNDENSKRSLSNYNHCFVNINLCKNKIKNCSTFYKIRGLNNNKENYSLKIKNNLHKEEITENMNLKDKPPFMDINTDIDNNSLYNKLINKAYTFVNSEQNTLNNENKSNHTIITTYNLGDKKNQNQKVDNNKNNSISINKLNTKINNLNSIKFVNLKSNENNLNVYLKKIKKYENGTYEGIMLNDKREIKGIMNFNNGAKYDGQWRNDKKNGKGIFTSSHYYNCKNTVGMKYEGEFKDDKFNGYGVTNYTNGDKYEGEWKNNKQYGKGIVTYSDGLKYDGEWKDGKFEGIGVLYLKNGERFEGRFIDNKYNGYGKYYYINGDYLEGIFKNDYPQGNCILHKSDGTIVNVVH